jgi:hypothetical protein
MTGSLRVACNPNLKRNQLQFVDEETGEQLVEFVEAARLRPTPPAAAKFSSWDQLKVRTGAQEGTAKSRWIHGAALGHGARLNSRLHVRPVRLEPQQMPTAISHTLRARHATRRAWRWRCCRTTCGGWA